MKILYVAPLVAGFQDILEGKKESKGLPSFIYPLKKLLQDDNQVDIILISNYKRNINIKVNWINNDNILANINNDFAGAVGLKRFFFKIKSLIDLSMTICKALKHGHYDFVYCHGTAAYIGNVLANFYNVRCGYRIYGVINLAHDIKKMGRLHSIIRHPIYYGIFRERKEFIMITDDGTYGDEVFKIYNPKASFPIYYLVNGVDKNFEYRSTKNVLDRNGVDAERYIFHAGRIARIKRQDRIIEVIHMLDRSGNKMHLLFAGHISDNAFYDELINKVKKYGLEEFVHFLGPIERPMMQSLSHDALATVLLGDCSNQGNVFFECAFAKSLIITYPEKSLKKYIVHNQSGFFVKDEKDAKEHIVNIINKKYDTKKIRIMLKENVDSKLQSWTERCKYEVDLIYGTEYVKR